MNVRSPRNGTLRGTQRETRRASLSAAGLAVAWLLGGCSSFGTLEPWVKPYERERLADPIMKFSRNALADKHTEHVRDVREGAHGATGVQGGGCGCK